MRIRQRFCSRAKRRADRHGPCALCGAQSVFRYVFRKTQAVPRARIFFAARLSVPPAPPLFFASYACIIENMTAELAAAASWRSPGKGAAAVTQCGPGTELPPQQGVAQGKEPLQQGTARGKRLCHSPKKRGTREARNRSSAAFRRTEPVRVSRTGKEGTL